MAAAVAGLPPAVRTVLLIAAMFACYGGAALLQVCLEGSDWASRGVLSPCCFSSPRSWSRRPLAAAPRELFGGKLHVEYHDILMRCTAVWRACDRRGR